MASGKDCPAQSLRTKQRPACYAGKRPLVVRMRILPTLAERHSIWRSVSGGRGCHGFKVLENAVRMPSLPLAPSVDGQGVLKHRPGQHRDVSPGRRSMPPHSDVER